MDQSWFNGFTIVSLSVIAALVVSAIAFYLINRQYVKQMEKVLDKFKEASDDG